MDSTDSTQLRLERGPPPLCPAATLGLFLGPFFAEKSTLFLQVFLKRFFTSRCGRDGFRELVHTLRVRSSTLERTPAHARAYPRILTCTRAYPHRLAHTCEFSCPRLPAHTHAHPRTLAHTHAHPRIPAHTRAYIRAYLRRYPCAYSRIPAHARRCPARCKSCQAVFYVAYGSGERVLQRARML